MPKTPNQSIFPLKANFPLTPHHLTSPKNPPPKNQPYSLWADKQYQLDLKTLTPILLTLMLKVQLIPINLMKMQ